MPGGFSLRRLRLSSRHVIFGVISFIFLFTLFHLHPLVPGYFHGSNEPVPIWPMATPSLPTHSEDVHWPQRAEEVKQAFLHAYHGWEKYAAPRDDLLPLTSQGVDDFNGWGVTMYDSLSTMLLMGLHDEFSRALPLIERQNFTLMPPKVTNGRIEAPVFAPFFETVIRYLGGLLSAYALSHEPILLDRADDLATKLSGAFNTTSGLPAYGVHTETGDISSKRVTILAEIASCQLEYSYLAKLTGKKEHYDRSANIMKVLEKSRIMGRYGMLPTRWDLAVGEPIPMSEQLSVGGTADSGHEYLLKLYLLTNQSDQASLDLYVQTANTILSTLLYVSSVRGLLYVTDLSPIPRPSHKFEHLSCFLPGLLALGVHTLPDTAFDNHGPTRVVHRPEADELRNYNWKELHMLAAQGLAESCYQMYEDQPSGLGPDEVKFRSGEPWIRELKQWRKRGRKGVPPGIGAKGQYAIRGGANDYNVRSGKYLLRPETLESIYIMWRTTGDIVWRERGWKIFQALEREAKTSSGYASLQTVAISRGILKDEMPSYFLAETLKYLYLLFRDDDLVPLDKWVFNTEAHPLPIFEWTTMERSKFGIP